jgi:hypothetical protein
MLHWQQAVMEAQAHHHLLRVHLLGEQAVVAVAVLQPQAQQQTVALTGTQAEQDLTPMQTVAVVAVVWVVQLIQEAVTAVRVSSFYATRYNELHGTFCKNS